MAIVLPRFLASLGRPMQETRVYKVEFKVQTGVSNIPYSLLGQES